MAEKPLVFQIDGVESLNNVLLIGMTNRKDLLDEALLRCSLSLSLHPSVPCSAVIFLTAPVI